MSRSHRVFVTNNSREYFVQIFNGNFMEDYDFLEGGAAWTVEDFDQIDETLAYVGNFTAYQISNFEHRKD